MAFVSKASAFPKSVQAGIPKLGDLPDGWSCLPLSKVLHEVARPIKMQDEENYNLVKVKRARGGVVERETLKGKDISVKSQFMVKPGDFLISKRQIVHGACGLVPERLDGTIVSNEYAILHGNEGIDLDFLNYLAHSTYFQQTCFHASIGVHVEKMIFKLPWWLAFRFHLPPVPEQKKIAKILSTWDRAIETVERLITNAQKQKKALMQQLLTGKKRFKEFEGQEWEETELKKIAFIYDGTHATPKYVKNGVPFYSVEHVSSDNFSKTKFISKEVYEKENKRVKLEKNDILMTRIGDVGTPKLINWDVKASFYVSLALIKVFDAVRPDFLCHYIASNDFQREIHKRMIHVAFPKKINLGEIGKCSVEYPSPDEQKKIASVLTSRDQEIIKLKNDLNSLQTQKKALMQQLLTGKRRVKV